MLPPALQNGLNNWAPVPAGGEELHGPLPPVLLLDVERGVLQAQLQDLPVLPLGLVAAGVQNLPDHLVIFHVHPSLFGTASPHSLRRRGEKYAAGPVTEL